MKLPRIFSQFIAGLLLAGALLSSGCKKTQEPPPPTAPIVDFSEPTEAQPKLPTIKLWLGWQHLGSEQMDAEMALQPREIQTGMMFRKSMGENDGMIFDLRHPQQTSFWMKNCFVPLSVAYIDPDGVIREIHPLEPHNTNSVVSTATNIRFALETPQGWFDRHNVRTGMIIRTERGSLMETFGQSR